MDYRGPPAMRGPPITQIRQRVPVHHPINHPAQVPLPPQTHQRFVGPMMNQSQWGAVPSEEAVNYPPQAFTPDAPVYNYPYHPQSLPSPDMINPNPPPPGFGNYQPQMYMQRQFIVDPQSSMYYHTPMMQPQPMVAPVEANSPTKKFQYNSKDNVSICSKCGHKNILWETEINKRDEQIDFLQRENQALKNEVGALLTEKDRLLSKLVDNQKMGEEEMSSELKNIGIVEMSEECQKNPELEKENVANEGSSIQKKLSPTAAEFSPSTTIVAATADEVPVVSAKGVMDDDLEAAAPVLEIEAGTQVEENLFEQSAEVLEPYTVVEKIEHENWSDEIERTIKEESVESELRAPEMKSEDQWDESSLPIVENSWRDQTSQTSFSEPWHQQQKQNRNRTHMRGNSRMNRGQSQPHGFVRGRRLQNDQEQHIGNNFRQQHNFRPGLDNSCRPQIQNSYGLPHENSRRTHDNYRQNFSHSQQRGLRNFQGGRHQRTDENRDHLPRRENKSNEGRNNHNQRYMNEYQKQCDESENRTGVLENCSTEKPTYDRTEESSNRDNGSQKILLKRDMSTRDSAERPRGPNAKLNNYNINKEEREERKESSPRLGDHNTIQEANIKQNQLQTRGKPDVKNVVKMMSGDLFSASGDFALAHCVARDFRMGSGIAVRFKNEFKRVGELLDQNETVGGCAHLNVDGRYVFYLVTKEFSNRKPKYEDLKSSLRRMRDKCLQFGVNKLAMPRIGCGLDKLDWARVKTLINEIFLETQILIEVYDFNVERVPEGEGSKTDNNNSLKMRYNPSMNLVDVEKETALLFLGTEDGFMDPTAKSLNAKFNFEKEYLNCEKAVGNVYCFNNKTPNCYDWVFALIVSKRKQDSFKFSNLEICCGQLSKMLRKEGFTYVGIEYTQEWSSDKTFFEKVLTLFRITLPKSMELWVCFPSPEMDYLNRVQ